MKYLTDVLFSVGFISFEYGLYLYDIKVAFVIGGLLLMLGGLQVAKHGTTE